MVSNKDEQKKAIEEKLKNSRNPVGARNALGFLFPKVEELLQTIPVSRSRDEARRKRQIHLKENAPAYFRLDPQPATWARSDIDEIFLTEDSSAAFIRAKSVIDAGSNTGERSRLRRQFLEALCDHFSNDNPIDLEWLVAIVNATPDFATEKDESEVGFFSLRDNFDRLEDAIIRGTQYLAGNERAPLFASAIPRAKDLSLLCSIFRQIAGDINPEGVKPQQSAFGDETDGLRNQLLDRVRTIASNGLIWTQVRPVDVVWFWWGCNQEEEIRAFTERTMQTSEGLRHLMQIPVNRVRSTSGDYDSVNLKSWEKVMNLNALEVHAKRLLREGKDEESQAIAARFLEALRRGRESPF